MGGKKAINIAVNILLWIIVALSAIVTVLVFTSQSNGGVPSLLGITPISIQTESMKPTLNKGDLVLTKKVDIKTLEVDDIISFWTIVDNQKVINTHKIVEITGDGVTSIVTLKTKGDANPTEDEKTVYPSDVISKYTGTKLPHLGALLTFLQTATGFLLCIVFPLVLFFLFQLYKFIKTLVEIKKETVTELTEQQKKEAVAEYLAMQEKEKSDNLEEQTQKTE